MQTSLDRKILYNRAIGSGYFRLAIEWETPVIAPGQFVMLGVSGSMDPFLRRPFGICNVLGEDKLGRGFRGRGIEILYRVVGRGTSLLSLKSSGDVINVLGPLGNGFPSPAKGKRPILVAGGVGVAPLYMLALHTDRGALLFGARSGQETSLIRGIKGREGFKVMVSTEDGTVGEKGLVTGLLKKEISGDSIVYACGPINMLKAVADIAGRKGATCLVSLERPMACGIGVCLGCAVKSKTHNDDEAPYRMVCRDGPVFDSEEIDWGNFS
jgi:dihydroorotate dehydrogenase electron transfer subunit